MKRINSKWIPWTLATVAAAVLAVSLSSRPAVADEHERDLNPKIHHALDALHDAHDEIDHAHHDFHGRKKEALEVLDRAINKLEEIKEYRN